MRSKALLLASIVNAKSTQRSIIQTDLQSLYIVSKFEAFKFTLGAFNGLRLSIFSGKIRQSK